MQIDQARIAEIVERVVESFEGRLGQEVATGGIFSTVSQAVEAAVGAQKRLSLLDREKREQLVAAMREAAMANARLLAEMAVRETGMGRVEDKILKNLLAAQKTPGTEDLQTQAYTGDHGLTLLEMAPFGVIGAITPVTNPSETIINNSIGMIAAGNAVVFSPHPSARSTSLKTVEILHEAIVRAGGPCNLIAAVQKPSMEAAQALMGHPGVNMLVATGGPGVVRAVLSSGKKAIGAGAGNPPVVVDQTADIDKAARDIIAGASFDNNLPCIGEKELIVVEEVADRLIQRLQREGAYILRAGDIDALTRAAFIVKEDGGGGCTATARKLAPNPAFIGRDVGMILREIGIDVGRDVRLAVMEVGPDHPFVTHEQMMPVLPLVKVSTVEDAIALAVKVEHGNRHTAIMHSKHVDYMTELARSIKTTIFVKNAPSYAGIGAGGEGFCSFTIAGPTGEGLTSARSFTRQRRCVLVDGFRII
ncbi:aldehyde dehydrogenase [Clostridiales bacterium PH28_bin88]|nr:aldehyde dehydrogenase [Clostridiales bacterium PH28_bin88]